MRKIDTYERFHRHIKAWAAREIESLVVLGKPGLGKSWAARTALADTPYHLFSARLTPIEVYNRLYDNPDWPVVFDDVSALMRDSNFIDMLKNLCEAGPATVRWNTSTDKLEGREKSFRCTSPVLILLNKIPEKNPDVKAILDRCDNILFEPSKSEVIGYIRQNFPQDGELIDLLAELPVLPSVRTLIKARQWRNSAYLSLTEELFSECGVPDPVVHLVEIMQGCRESEWCQGYVEATGLTDRTYRRHKAIATEIISCQGGQTDIGLGMRSTRAA
ncbi:MAG: hypothetical protein V3U10_01245 [Bacteroidota bacterium]